MQQFIIFVKQLNLFYRQRVELVGGTRTQCATFLCDQEICSFFDMHGVVVVTVGSTIRLRSYINYFTVIMHLKHAVTISALS